MGGDPGLAQRQGRVAAAQGFGRHGPKAVRLERLRHAAAQDCIEEAAAAQADGAASGLARCCGSPARQALRQQDVEPGGRLVGIALRLRPGEQLREQRARIEIPQVVGVGPEGRFRDVVPGKPACGCRFEGHRGLGLVGLPNAQAQGTGRRIEPAAGTACGGAIQSRGEHALHAGRKPRPDARREAGSNPVTGTERVQGGRRHAPRLACRGIAAGQRQRPQASQALPAMAADPQQFAAPGGAVGAESDAVERQADDGFVQAVFGHHRRDVRMVVLHRDGRHAPFVRQRDGDARAVEVGMQVMRHGRHRRPGFARECPQ